MEEKPQQDLHPVERDRIELFETDYNAIKAELARLLNKPDKTGLNELVADYGRVHRSWLNRDGTELLELAQVRNTLVHDRVQPYEYLAVPTALALARINAILRHLAQPLQVAALQTSRHVMCVTPHDSIIRVLALVARYDYSQFPVYEQSTYRGLLTTNGIARWLSNSFRENDTLSCVTDCLVSHVLAREEPVVVAFCEHERGVEEVIEQFSSQSELVCLLVTSTGTEHGIPQQIITRYDVANMLARLVEEE
jgi:predicted transcriptional regulator